MSKEETRTVGENDIFFLNNKTDYYRCLFVLATIMGAGSREEFNYNQRMLKAFAHDVAALVKRGELQPFHGKVGAKATADFRGLMFAATEAMQKAGYKFEEKGGELVIVDNLEAYD